MGCAVSWRRRRDERKMCKWNKEENKLMGERENELCSIEQIYGKNYQCDPKTVKACQEAEQALKD
jgi:hypothetical protein